MFVGNGRWGCLVEFLTPVNTRVKIMDMFYVPLMMLASFVFLGNFAAKLWACIEIWFPPDLALETILASSRKMNEEPTSNQK
jgi:hypothetical protein